MTSEEIANTMWEKVHNSKGIVFVHADDWTWVYKDGVQILSQHSIPAKHILEALNVPYDSFYFEDDDAATIYDERLY